MIWLLGRALSGFLTGFFFAVGERAACLAINHLRDRRERARLRLEVYPH